MGVQKHKAGGKPPSTSKLANGTDKAIEVDSDTDEESPSDTDEEHPAEANGLDEKCIETAPDQDENCPVDEMDLSEYQDEYAFEENVDVLQATIETLMSRLAQKEALIAERDAIDAERDAVVATLQRENAELREIVEEFRCFQSEFARNVKTAVFEANSPLMSRIEALETTMVSAKLIDTRALSVDSQHRYSEPMHSYANVAATAPAPKKVKISDEEKYQKMSKKEKRSHYFKSNKPASDGLLIVHIQGFPTKNKSPKTLGIVLQGKYGFPAKNIKDASAVTSDLVECVINSASYPALVQALSTPNCKYAVRDDLDVSGKLFEGDDEFICKSRFQKRITTSATRMETANTGDPEHRNMVALWKNYRDHGIRRWSPAPRPTPIYMEAFHRRQWTSAPTDSTRNEWNPRHQPDS